MTVHAPEQNADSEAADSLADCTDSLAQISQFW